ncbi:hypothetical protein EHQ55_15050, partial [Leptospira meyeri]|uniref:hypothetical protein n=1 Tax=Leptospira meyeri TaxID=29508 RepID=UPI00108274CA
MFLETDPILKIVHDFRKKIIFEKIPNLPESNFIQSLWYYFEDGTQRFYDKECFAAYFSFLNYHWINNKELLVGILNDNSYDLNRNLPALRELNKAELNDTIIPSDNYDVIQLVDTVFNPRYLKAIEGPYFSLTYPIAACLRHLRSASEDG